MRLNLAAVNQVFLTSKLIKATHPYFINEGECAKWAFCAYCLYGGQLYSTQNHAFLKLDQKFYDAEALDGVVDWRDLRVHKDCMELLHMPLLLTELEEEDFLFEWDLDTVSIIPLLVEIRKILREDK